MSLDQSARAEIARLWLDGSESVGRTRREKWPLRRRADAATGAPVLGLSVVVPGTRPDRVNDGQVSGGQAGSPTAGERVARRDRAAARQEMMERLFEAKVDQS